MTYNAKHHRGGTRTTRHNRPDSNRGITSWFTRLKRQPTPPRTACSRIPRAYRSVTPYWTSTLISGKADATCAIKCPGLCETVSRSVGDWQQTGNKPATIETYATSRGDKRLVEAIWRLIKSLQIFFACEQVNPIFEKHAVFSLPQLKLLLLKSNHRIVA